MAHRQNATLQSIKIPKPSLTNTTDRYMVVTLTMHITLVTLLDLICKMIWYSPNTKQGVDFKNLSFSNLPSWRVVSASFILATNFAYSNNSVLQLAC